MSSRTTIHLICCRSSVPVSISLTFPGGTTTHASTSGRSVRGLDYSDALKIGNFDAIDFFGDGSFYVLDCPGVSLSFLSCLKYASLTMYSS